MKLRCSMNRQKIINEIKQNFIMKRIRAQEEAENNIKNLCKDKTFNTLYTQYSQKKLDYLKSTYETENLMLKHDVEDLKIKIDQYLNQLGVDKSKLVPKYECKICNDTGIAGGRMCNCLSNALNLKISTLTSTQTDFKSFEDSNQTLLDETDKKAYEILKVWCEKYPNITKTNINIIGGVGSGKTFMLECVAKEMMRQNQFVCYKTAFDINELARLYHIGKSYEFSDCINADILIIDDLGTEPVLKNVTKEYLYNLINTRQINKKPTFISTNLSLSNILDRYDERIFSRLANKNLAINISLTSQDKRVK